MNEEYSEKTRLESLKLSKGKTINNIQVAGGNIIKILFADKTTLTIGNCNMCCECRYFATDDDVDYYKGTILLDIQTRSTVYKNDIPCDVKCCRLINEDCDHAGDGAEVQFLLITTNLGVITIQAYNKHNGYYAGINLEYAVV